MTYFDHYYPADCRIFVVDWEGKEKDFSPEFLVTNIFCDIKSRKRFLEIAFYANGHEETTVLERKSLAESALTELVDKGFTLANTDRNRVTLAEILMLQEEDCQLKQCHTHLGYQQISDKNYYFGTEEASGQMKSRYLGTQELSKCGKYCEWRETIEGFLSRNPLLALPLAMGVSAPIATRLKGAGVSDETLLWALIGATSTGKTTCLRLSASAWGTPSGDGIIDNLTGTEKYFFASLARHNGWPSYFDETSAVTWDFTRAIYTVALSREGGRCNPDGTPKSRKTWSGAVIFTGETSMFHRTNGNGGLHARLLEFDFAWFEDEKMPDEIQRFVAHNHGTAWLELINCLSGVSDDDLIARYDECICIIKMTVALRSGFTNETWSEKKFTGVQIRIIKKLSVLLLSLGVMAEAWTLDLNHSVIMDGIFAAYEHNASRVDKIDEFVEGFVQYIARHRNEFPSVDSSGYDASRFFSAKGYQSRYAQKPCIWILADDFEKQLSIYGLDASAPTMRELHRRGHIAKFNDRYKKKYKTGQIEPLCVCFYPPNTQTNISTKDNNKKTSKQLTNLLAD